MIKRECVDEEGWVSEETFKTTLAVYQVLPGPEAHELCVYFGRIRGGKLGGFLAGLGFMLPGFLLMLGLSVLYVEADLGDQLAVVFYGFSAAVVALLARALVRLGRSFVTDLPLAVLAAAAFALVLLAPASPVLVLLGAGLAYEIWKTAGRRAGGVPSFSPVGAARAARPGRGDVRPHDADLSRRPDNRPAHVRRRLHGDPASPGERGGRPPLADPGRSSSTASPWEESSPPP